MEKEIKADKPAEKAERKALNALPVADFLKKLPKNMKGASKVETLVNPADAKYCLVHIRQIHDDGLSPKDLLKMMKKVEKGEQVDEPMIPVQTDIHLILLHLRSVYGGKFDVHSEGLTPRSNEPRARMTAVLEQSAEMLDKLGELEKRDEKALADLLLKEAKETDEDKKKTLSLAVTKQREQLKRIREMKTDMTAKIRENRPMLTDLNIFNLAAGYLANGGNIRLKPAETDEIRLEITKTLFSTLSISDKLEKEKNEDKQKELIKELKTTVERMLFLRMDGREDALLEIGKNPAAPVTVSVYGGAHDWKNNVEAWNKKNPKEKYSLVVITPTSYDASSELAKKQAEAKKKKGAKKEK